MTKGEQELAWALGIGAAVVAAIMFWPKSAAAAAAATVNPATAQVILQPGASSVAVAPGGTVTLVLPTGASWNTATTTPVMPLGANGVQPTGSASQAIVMNSTKGQFPITASWVDATNTAQVTFLNVIVS